MSERSGGTGGGRRERSGGRLLITRGDPASLVSAIANTDGADASRTLLWHLEEPGPSSAMRRHAAVALAMLLGVPSPRIESEPFMPLRGRRVSPSARDSIRLLVALQVAASERLDRVVWPRVVGPDPARIDVELQRIALVESLVELDRTDADRAGGECPRPMIETPLLDLEPRSVIELGVDLSVPFATAWPCDRAGGDPSDASAPARPCTTCDGCLRWLGAFRELGVAWPWAADVGDSSGEGADTHLA